MNGIARNRREIMSIRCFATVLFSLFVGFAPSATAQEGADAPKAATKKAAGKAASKKPSPADMRPTWYAQTLSQGPGGLNVAQFWSKAAMLRTETVISGKKVVTIVKGEWYIVFDGTKGVGIRVRRTQEAQDNDAPFKRPFGNEAEKLIRLGAEKIRDENFHGRPASVFQLTDGLGRRTVWASADALNIPLRIEFYNRRTAMTQNTDYIDWLTGLVIPQEFFLVDSRIELVAYEFEEYVHFTSKVGGVGPVPVLYMDLLRGH
jgi:hypothetical protein